MAREWQFNPPPNWPVPSQTPGLDWRPDPQWGPIPIGWELWRRRRTTGPRTRVTAMMTAAAGLASVLALQFSGLDATAGSAPRLGPELYQGSVHPVQLDQQLAFQLRTVAGTGLYGGADRLNGGGRNSDARP